MLVYLRCNNKLVTYSSRLFYLFEIYTESCMNQTIWWLGNNLVMITIGVAGKKGVCID